MFQVFVDCHGQKQHNTTIDDQIVILRCRKSPNNCKWTKIDYEVRCGTIKRFFYVIKNLISEPFRADHNDCSHWL